MLHRVLAGGFAVFVLLGVYGAAAAETAPAGRVRGAVTGPDRKPLAGRLVMLASVNGAGELRVTSTDERGQYQFRDLPPGMYEVRVEAEGFETGVKSAIEVKPPFQNVVDIPMRPLGAPAATPPGSLGALRKAATAAGAPLAPPGATAPVAVPTADAAATPEGAAPAAVPGPVPVQGMLRDKEGAPILEATVVVLPLAGGALFQGRSDRDGKFRIEAVPPGFYRLLIRSPGNVPIDLSRVEVPPVTGLALRLVLADYPINFKAGPDTSLPPERPRPWPPLPPATVVPAPEPEEGPQTPPTPEPSR